MNTNIVSYIIETTSMNQTDIAERLSNLNDDKKGISQASVSKWNRGEKIPKGREQELLMIADLYWELEDKYTEDDDFMFEQESLIDSRWNIIVKSEKNQEDWYNFFKDMLAPKQFINVNSKYKDSDFVKFVRECIFALNDAGFKVPENPESIKKNTSSRFFDFFKFWMHRITILQYWCPNSIPHKHEDFEFEKLYNNLPRIALAQVALDDIDVPEQTNGVLLRNFTEDLNQFVKSTIKGYYQWEELRMENFFGDDSFNELLIYPKNDNKDELSQSSSQIESNESESIDDRYLSYAERKIMDRLNANEKLIRELHQKIDSLIDQNNKGD